MLGLLKGRPAPILSDLGIAFPIRHPAHGQVHADLGALSIEIGPQVLHNILGRTLGHAHHVLRGPAHLGALLHKLAGRRLALGTFLGGLIALMHITTNTADILAHNCIPPSSAPSGKAHGR